MSVWSAAIRIAPSAPELQGAAPSSPVGEPLSLTARRDWRHGQPLLEGAPIGLARRPWVVVSLLALALLPRVWSACTSQILWGDAILYYHSSQALLHGDYGQAFSAFGLNIYTLLLAGFQWLGLDWQVCGQWWSVLAATLTVLPLWGWVRRMFDDRVAIVACIAYAVHGKLVAISPLVIRDSTFWLLFTTALYCTWRAAVEVKLRWFLAAGVTIMLAIFTRTEGLLLLVPLVGWCLGRLGTLGRERLRFALGPALCLLMLPATLAVVNWGWLRNNPQWTMLRAAHVRMAWEWWQSRAADNTPQSAHHATELDDLPLGVDASSRSWSAMTYHRKTLTRLMHAYTYAAGLLTLIGLWSWWRGLLRRDHLTLFAMNMLLLAMIRVRYARAGLDIRYFMPMILVSLPWMALGFFWIVDRAGWVIAWLCGPARGPRYALAGTLGLGLAIGSMADGHLAGARLMQRQADVGKWILQKFGPGQTLGGYFVGLDLASYSAHGHTSGAIDPRLHGVEEAVARVPALHADVLLFEVDDEASPLALELVQRIEKQYGYQPIPDGALPASCEGVKALIRPSKAQQ